MNRFRETALIAACIGGLLAAVPEGSAAEDRFGDPLPPCAVARLGTTRWRASLRDGSGFARLCFSPDGNLVACVGDSELYLWETASGKRVGWSPDLTRPGAALFSSDGKTLLTDSVSPAPLDPRDPLKVKHLLQRWEVGTGKLLGQKTFLRSSTGYQHSLLSDDGRMMVFNDPEKKVRLLSAESGEVLRDIDQRVEFTPFTMSADGRRLALVDVQGKLSLYDTVTGKELHSFSVERKTSRLDGYHGASLSPDGKTLVGSSRQGLRVWDADTGELRNEWANRRGGAVFSPDGRLMAVSDTGAVHLYEVGPFKEVRSFEGNSDPIHAMALSADGKLLATAHPHRVNVWDVATGKLLTPAPGHRGSIVSLAWSANGDRLISGSEDATAIVWDLDGGKVRHRLLGHSLAALGVAYAPDGKTVATGDGTPRTGGPEAHVRIWNPENGRLLRQFAGHRNCVQTLTYSADGKQLLTTGYDLRVRLWDPQAGRQLQHVKGGVRKNAVAFTPDHSAVLVGAPGELKLWGARDGKLIRELIPQHRDGRDVDGIGFLDGGRTAWAIWQGNYPQAPPRLALYDLEKGQEVRSVPLPEATDFGYFSHAMSPDGRTVVVGWEDRSGRRSAYLLRVWDIESGVLLATLPGHTGSILALAFAPDGKTLASGSRDTTILTWDVGRTRLQILWGDLTGEREAAVALREAKANPALTAELVRDRLASIAAAELPARKVIADLDADDFAVREKASADLDRLPPEAECALRLALQGDPSPETRSRLEVALVRRKNGTSALSTFEPQRVRSAVGVLEKVDHRESRAALEELARGRAESFVTREAAAALARLKGSHPRP